MTAHEAIAVLAEAAAGGGLGEGSKQPGGITSCPNCGGYMMSRSAIMNGRNVVLNVGTGQMASPAPQCVDCGYNGMYMLGVNPTTGARD
jgi:hypothetical protein